jgi:hypothetical protein
MREITKVETKGEDLVTVSFRCTAQQKSDLLKKSTDEAGTTLTEYLKMKVFEESAIQPDVDAKTIEPGKDTPSEEIDAYEKLISRLRTENSDMRFELYQIKKDKAAPAAIETSILPEEVETVNPLSELIALPNYIKVATWCRSDEPEKSDMDILSDCINVTQIKLKDLGLI